MPGFTIRAKVTGLDDLKAGLARLKTGKRNGVLRTACRKAAAPVRRQVKAALAGLGYSGGLLDKSIGVKVGVSRKGNVFAVVGPRTGFKGPRSARVLTPLGLRYQKAGANPSYYAHLVELGTKPHALGKGSRLTRTTRSGKVRPGQQRGRVHPGARRRPFIGPGLARAEGQAGEILRREIGEGLVKLARAKGG